jgi:hypothetical protein
MRSEGGYPISNSAKGPVIPSAVPTTQADDTQPWANDPDGNAAGWLKVIVLNDNLNSPPSQAAQEQWIWTSNTLQFKNLVWLQTPSGLPASWLICGNTTYWATGTCPSQLSNTVTAKSSRSSPNIGSNPSFQAVIPRNPITPPSSGTKFILVLPDSTYLTPNPRQTYPNLTATAYNFPIGASAYNYTYTITYDGVSVLSFSGSGSHDPNDSGNIIIQVPTSGWIYDPASVPGYNQGNYQWVWTFSGTASSNSSPEIYSGLTYSSPPGTSFSCSAPTVIYYTA